MSKRRYNQYCAVARALDIVGERWTLLIVRELLSGPKRFKDLLVGLPGIGTNLLTARLKDLEGYGVVRRTILPPPAGQKRGVALVMIASDRAPGLSGPEDVGEQGELPVILESFRFGSGASK